MDQQNLEKCRKFLPGLTEECWDIFAKLAQILEEKVLEIWEGENGDYYAGRSTGVSWCIVWEL